MVCGMGSDHGPLVFNELLASERRATGPASLSQNGAMEAFLVSLSSVALAEMGDRTQLLTLVLATQYRRPWPIIAGILVATLANHLVAGEIGILLGRELSPVLLNAVVGVSLIAMAIWTLIPDKADKITRATSGAVFLVTVVSFFVAEMGDKTQIATVALAAGYGSLIAVVAGSTLGLMAANVPVAFAGTAFAQRLPMALLRRIASALFFGLGVLFLGQALWKGLQ